MLVTDRDVLDSPELGVEIASALWRLYPQQFTLHAISSAKLASAKRDAIEGGKDPRDIAAGVGEGSSVI